MLKTVIFMGRSGAGKGVQSEILRKALHEKTGGIPILYVETGQHFRDFVKKGGHTWDLARAVNDRGARQPDFLAIWIWSDIFIREIKGNEHIVFDGTPRSVNEAHMLDTALKFYEREEPVIVFLKVSEEVAEKRLAGRGRADDLNPEVVARRLAFFNADVAPAVDFYRTAPGYKFLEIDGEQSPEKVHEEIMRGVGL